MTGSRQRVLVTGRSTRDAQELSARTDNNRVVNFAGDSALVGSYVDIVVMAALPHSLRGELAA
jgi:tRNA-2-methylthio-N6-dimethylallyladenosine synthase